MSSENAPFTPFVLIFQGRCGSTYLMEALGSHPDIHCWMEYFATLKEHGKSAQNQIAWLESFFTPPPPTPCLALGFKTKLADVLDRDRFARILKEKSAAIIHLHRRNVIKTTVSFFNSVRINQNLGDWNLYDESDRLSPISIDPMQFDSWLKRVEEHAEEEAGFVKSLHLPNLHLCYEDLMTNENESLERIFAFLGLKNHPVKGKAIKMTSDNLRVAIQNFDSLRSGYTGTRYERMFDEVLVGG